MDKRGEEERGEEIEARTGEEREERRGKGAGLVTIHKREFSPLL